MNTLSDKLSMDAYSRQASQAPQAGVEKLPDVTSAPPLRKPEDTEGQALEVAKVVSQKSALSEEELVGVMKSINQKLEKMGNYLQFSKDEVSGRNVFTLMDANSKDVIKQYPSEEFLHVSRRLTEYLQAELSKETLSDQSQVGAIISSIV